MYYPYCTITSCTASTVVTSPCTASNAHSLMYYPYCTITSCTASTVQSLRRVPSLLHNHHNRTKLCYKNRSPNGLHPRSTRPKPTGQNPVVRVAEVIRSMRSAQWPAFPRITAVHSRWAVSFVSICKRWVVR
jgi:hypothetical protein